MTPNERALLLEMARAIPIGNLPQHQQDRLQTLFSRVVEENAATPVSEPVSSHDVFPSVRC